MYTYIFNKLDSKLLLYITLAATLLIALACGTSAPETTAPETATSAPPPAVQATSAPAPVATATSVAIPQDVTVNPGTVTIMNAVWGNEYFDPRDTLGENLNYTRPLHAFWVNGNKDLELIPGVASEWEISPDGLTWTFTIREGIKFHNGDELTIEDALFTMEFVYGPEAREKALSPSKLALAKLTDKIEAVGNDVKITFRQAQAYLAAYHAQGGVNTTGALLPKKYFEAVGQDQYNLEPVGAGPFQVVKFRRTEQILMERFDDYYYTKDNGFPEDRRARFQTLDMRLVPEASTRVAALQAGDADIVEASVAVRKQVEDAGGRIIFGREATYVWLILMGCQNVEFPCNKQDVRYALDYAIDKEAIMYGLYGEEGACVCGYNFASPSTLGYSPEIDPFPFDPDKAKELLARAGYPNGEGFGTLNMYTWIAGDLPFMPELAQLVADQWKQNLGINAEVEVGDAATIRNRWFGRELYGGVLIRPNETKYDAASSLTGYYTDFEGKIHYGAEREDLKQAVITAKAEIDPAKRQQAYNDMYKVLYEAHYAPSLGHVHLPWGVSSRVATWEPWPVTPYVSSLWTITLK